MDTIASTRQKRRKEFAREIHETIERALQLDDPLSNLSLSQGFGIEDDTDPCNKKRGREKEPKMEFWKSPLPKNVEKGCMHLFESNMADLYRSSSWGLDLQNKAKEFHHPHSRFLILQGDKNDSTRENPQILAFSHFRFEGNHEEYPTEEVLYIYELQVHSSVRRNGYGQHLMSILEAIAKRTQMKKVILTVFKSNSIAINFYKNKMHYAIDPTSPSQNYNQQADYEILSKHLYYPKTRKRKTSHHTKL